MKFYIKSSSNQMSFEEYIDMLCKSLPKEWNGVVFDNWRYEINENDNGGKWAEFFVTVDGEEVDAALIDNDPDIELNVGQLRNDIDYILEEFG